MQRGYIAVLDSGIGGISVLNELIKLLPNEQFLYFGDNKNAPYGNKSVTQLRDLSQKNIDYLKTFGVKILVLGCNTLTTNLKNEIANYSKVPIFGVYPPIVQAKKSGKKILMLATKRTAEIYENQKNVTVVGLATLAQKIEKEKFRLNSFNFGEIFDRESGFDHRKIKGVFDTIILGCTHYEFIKNQISDHLRPRLILSGQFFTAQKVQKYILNQKSLEKHKRFELKFVGDCAEENKSFYVSGGHAVVNFRKKQ